MKLLPLLFACLASSNLLAAAQAPNILFAIADDWGLHAGAYGTEWIETPNFDRVAEQGLLFSRAYTPNAKCAPSRACILTGRNSWQLKAAANHWCFFPPEFKTWCEVLVEHGWRVGHTQKGWAPGIALDENGQPRQLTGKAWNRHHTKPPTKGISNNDYAANFEDFLDAAPEGEPWAFWYGAGEPHRDYEFGSSIKQGRKPSEIDHVPSYWPDNETVRTDMLDYALEVEHFDTHLGRMLATLEKRGQLENTLVIVTSDHGMPFPRAKGQAYDDSNHVPFAIMWPKGIDEPGRNVDGYVSFVDLAPTLLKLAGLRHQDTGMAEFALPGATLDYWFSDPAARPDPAWRRQFVLIGKERHDIGRPHDWGYPIRGIVKDDQLYLRNYESERWPAGNPETGYLNSDGGATKTEVLEARRKDPDNPHWQHCFAKRLKQELYDLNKDPHCLNNIIEAVRAENPSLLTKLEQLLESELKQEGDPRSLGDGHVFDEYVYADERRRGFYERYTKGEQIETRWVNQSDFENELEAPTDCAPPKLTTKSSKARADKKRTVLALGDSITAGSNGPTYRQFLAPELAKHGLSFIGPRQDAHSAHAGFGGRNSSFLLDKIHDIYKKYPADFVLLHTGHNHFAKNQPVPQILKDTEAIVRALHDINPKIVVLIAKVIPAGKLPKYSYIHELNDALPSLVTRLKQSGLPVILVDHARDFDWRTDTLADKVHPNLEGAHKMALRWLEALRPML